MTGPMTDPLMMTRTMTEAMIMMMSFMHICLKSDDIAICMQKVFAGKIFQNFFRALLGETNNFSVLHVAVNDKEGS